MNEEFVNEAQLADWLTDLRLPRIRDRLPGLLDEAARQELSLRDLVVFLCRHRTGRSSAEPGVATLEASPLPDGAGTRRLRLRGPAERQSGSAPGPRHRPLGGTR